MKKLLCLACIFGFLFACNNKPDSRTNIDKAIGKYDVSKDTSVYTGEMKRYWLVFLKKGPNRNHDSVSAAKIQETHIANINRLANEGKIIMAGPIGTDGDLRGIFIMDCTDSSEVEKFVNTDTAVITGRLRMEYYPWWSEKGKYIFK